MLTHNLRHWHSETYEMQTNTFTEEDEQRWEATVNDLNPHAKPSLEKLEIKKTQHFI